MSHYYNEIEPYCVAWLRALMAAGEIPEGDIDDRSIELVRPADLSGYTQCHFFAGIGGWPLALRLAGWPEDEPIWTGSCPCQPFSAAGQRRGTDDPRHLWPHFRRLIALGGPPVVAGEQVASKAGREWLAGVRGDLEALGYAVGASDLCSASVGAPHIRQRLYWVANSECNGGRADEPGRQSEGRTTDGWARGRDERSAGGLGLALPAGLPAPECEVLRGQGRRGERGATCEPGGSPVRMDDSSVPRCAGNGQCREDSAPWESARLPESPGRGAPLRLGDTQGERCGEARDAALTGSGRHSHGASWSRFDVVHCRDGKARRFEPQPQQMVDGIPAIVGRLRADAQQKIEEQIADAEITESDARKALRDLWISHAEETLRNCTGGLRRVPEAAVLLSIMRELAREGWRLVDDFPPACWASAEDGLRELRQASSPSSCPSFGLEPSQQRAGKPKNAVPILSQALAREAAAAGLITYPLAEGRPGRVGQLRGYGNAITPAVAKEFIKAYMEAINEDLHAL